MMVGNAGYFGLCPMCFGMQPEKVFLTFALDVKFSRNAAGEAI